MYKQTMYTYLGENGTITSPILLNGIYSIQKYHLVADDNKQLTKDGKIFYKEITIPASDIDNWYEVDA